MKKVISALLLMILTLVCLSGCFKPFYYYDYETMKEEIEKVEIIYIHPYEGGFYPEAYKHYDLINTLTGEEKDKFLFDFCKIAVTNYLGRANHSPAGYFVKLYYKDTRFSYMTDYVLVEFDFNRDPPVDFRNFHADEYEFSSLLSKYMEQE